MTESRPLSYPTWECVLPYLNYGKRANLSSKCPALQGKHHDSPVYIQNLEITPFKLKIDNCTVQLGIIQQYHNGKNPEYVEERNRFGGFPYEVDKYGFPTEPDVIGFLENNPLVYDADREKFENDTAFFNSNGDHEMFRRMNKLRHERKIRELDEKFLPMRLKESGQEPPYSQFVQFRIIDSGSVVNLEKLEYSKPLHDFWEYQIRKLFADKKGSIENLQIDFKSVARFPQLKLILENFEIKKARFTGEDIRENYRHPLMTATERFYAPFKDEGRGLDYWKLVRSCFFHEKFHENKHFTTGVFSLAYAKLAMAAIAGYEQKPRKREKERLRGTQFPHLFEIPRWDTANLRLYMTETQKPDLSIGYILHVKVVVRENRRPVRIHPRAVHNH